MKNTVLAIALITFFVGCNKSNEVKKPALSLDEVKGLICGKYVGRYAKGKEFFEIRPDGTFSQVFIRNGSTNYDNQGTWSFEKFEDRYLIRFKSLMSLRDATSAAAPPKSSIFTATYFDAEPRVYFGDDYITKQPETANTNSVVK